VTSRSEEKTRLSRKSPIMPEASANCEIFVAVWNFHGVTFIRRLTFYF
jgi:hypothetical protein